MITFRSLPLCALLFSGMALAAWDDVQRLEKNSAVRVKDDVGKTRSGQLASVTATSLVVVCKGAEISIPRENIAHVAVKSNARRVRNALIGAGIGIAAGVVTDQTLGVRLRNEGSQSTGARAATILLPAAVIGGIKAAMPAYRTVYKAPK